jgi:hypothetical protein
MVFNIDFALYFLLEIIPIGSIFLYKFDNNIKIPIDRIVTRVPLIILI